MRNLLHDLNRAKATYDNRVDDLRRLMNSPHYSDSKYRLADYRLKVAKLMVDHWANLLAAA